MLDRFFKYIMLFVTYNNILFSPKRFNFHHSYCCRLTYINTVGQFGHSMIARLFPTIDPTYIQVDIFNNSSQHFCFCLVSNYSLKKLCLIYFPYLSTASDSMLNMLFLFFVISYILPP